MKNIRMGDRLKSIPDHYMFLPILIFSTIGIIVISAAHISHNDFIETTYHNCITKLSFARSAPDTLAVILNNEECIKYLTPLDK